MAFELSHRKHIEEELTRIVGRQLQKATRALEAGADDTFRTAVHESRKSVKKVRAIAALLRETETRVPRKDRKRLKEASAALSTIRDSQAIIDTLDSVRKRYPKGLPEHTYGVLRRGLVRARDEQEQRGQHDGTVADAVEQMKKTRRSAKHWKASAIDVSDLLDVITSSYRRSRRAMKDARTTRQSATLHRWRKELKRLWYQLRLAKRLTNGVAPLLADLDRLETDLGNDHNLVVLGATLRGCRDLAGMRAEIREVERLAVRMRQQLRRRAFALGGRIHARKPRALARWLRAASEQARQATAA